MKMPFINRPRGSCGRESNGHDGLHPSNSNLGVAKKAIADRSFSSMSRTPSSLSPVSRSMTLLPSSGSAFSSKGTGILTAQLHRLLVAHFPFEDIRELNMWLSRPPVSNAWNDFAASVPPHAELPHKPTVISKVLRAIDAANKPLPDSMFTMYRPDMRDWALEDHYVRFVVVVVRDSLLEEVWTLDEWRAEGRKIAGAVYEALVYLMGTVEFLEKNHLLALDGTPGSIKGLEEGDEYPWEEVNWESDMG